MVKSERGGLWWIPEVACLAVALVYLAACTTSDQPGEPTTGQENQRAREGTPSVGEERSFGSLATPRPEETPKEPPLPTPAGMADLEPIPRPDLDGLEDVAVEQFERQWELLQSMLQRKDADPAEAGQVIGQMGMLYHAYEVLDSAAVCYRNALRLQPEAFLWPYYLARLSRERGRLEETVVQSERALSREPKDLPALLLEAEALAELGRSAKARHFFQRVLDLKPDTAAALVGLGKIESVEGRYSAAADRFEEALKLQPEATAIHYPLSMAYRRLGQEAKAEEHLKLHGRTLVEFKDPHIAAVRELTRGVSPILSQGRRFLDQKRYKEALKLFEKAVQNDPENPAARHDLAFVYAGLGRHQDAARQYVKLLELKPDPELAAMAQANLGAYALSYGKNKDALSRYNKALELHEADPEAHRRAGEILWKLHRPREAVDHFLRAAELDPENPEIVLELSDLLRALNRTKEAERWFGRLLEQASPWLRQRRSIQEIVVALGKGEAARAGLNLLETELRRDLRERPADSRARFDLALVLLHLGQRDDVLKIYGEIVESSKNPEAQATAHFNLGRLVAEAGDYQGSVDHFRASLDLKPGDKKAHWSLARVLERQGRLEDAVEEYRKVVDFSPEDVPARVTLAAALSKLGRDAEALRWLKIARAFAPEEPRLAAAEARILAASPDDGIRDGGLALKLASSLYNAFQTVNHAEILAMALAESGQMEKAVSLQTELLEKGKETASPGLIHRLQKNLGLYRQGRPCRNPW